MTATIPDYERAPVERTDHPHVLKSADTLGGEPRVEETRLSVRQIFEMAEAGMTVAGIVEAYPDLNAGQVHDALSYAHDHPGEIAEYQDQQDIRAVMRDHDLVLIGMSLVQRDRLGELYVPTGTLIYTWETLPPELER